MPDEQRLYRDLAWLWPVISPPDDYVEESLHLVSLLNHYSQIPCRDVLHLGCGGGHHDATLSRHVSLTGVDLNPAMLDHARRLNPAVTYHQGDMRSVSLDQRFDAVLLLDSNHYLASFDDLRAVFSVAMQHLKPGGVLLTVVEWLREEFIQNDTRFSSHEQGNLNVTLVEHLFDPDPHDTRMECTFVYLIRENGIPRTEVDVHHFGLFYSEEWITLMTETGFEVDVADSSILTGDLCGLLILAGRKPL